MKTLLLGTLALLVLVGPPAAAQGYDPFTTIAQFESSYGTNLHNSTSTSSGIFGFLDSTWQQDLKAMGVSGPSSAYQASNSLQFAVAAYEIDQRGLSAWMCNNCDPKLNAYVDSHGGAGAYTLSGLSTDPNSYASVDSTDGLQTYFQSNGGMGVAQGGGGSSPSAPPNASVAQSATIFSFFYNKIMLGVVPRVNGMIGEAKTAMWKPLIWLLALAIAIRGFQTMNGSFDSADFLFFIFRAAIVVGFIGPSWYFVELVQKPLLGLPNWFATIFDSTAPQKLSSPASFFDACYTGLYATSQAVWHATPWSMHMILTAIQIAIGWYLGVGALFCLFVAFLIGNFLVLLLVITAPFFIPALLFRATTQYFLGWVHASVTALVTALLINVLLGMYFTLITDMITAYSPTGSPTTDLAGFMGLVVGLLIMGVTTAFIPHLARAIGHGVHVSVDAASKHMSGQMIVQHTSAAGRLLGKLG